MIRRIVFMMGHLVIRPRVIYFYFKLKANDNRTYKELESNLLININKFINFCNSYVPFYKGKLNIKKDLYAQHVVLNDIPILNKIDIIKNKELFEVNNIKIGQYKASQTGGSTGDPLKFRISKKCDDMGLAILYRGLSRGGYKLGDKVAVMAGGSLIAKELSWKANLINIVMNVRKYSSYGVNDALLYNYYRNIYKWRPKYFRGYPSAIFEFAKFIEKNKLTLTFDTVYTTAEMLSLEKRKYIEKVFKATVYDCYGLNDGGITAFECKNHDGYHIDMERGFLEVVNEDGCSVVGEEGRIIATSFLNQATPFVRYNTGDIGIVSKEKCSCGLPFPMLKGLKGRVTDTLKINDCLIGSPVLTVLMSKFNVLRYQFIMRKKNTLDIVIEPSENYVTKVEEFEIQKSLESQVGEFELNFIYDVDEFVQSSGGKHKIVINNSEQAQ